MKLNKLIKQVQAQAHTFESQALQDPKNAVELITKALAYNEVIKMILTFEYEENTKELN